MRRRLDAELVRRGLARSRGEAVEFIRADRVTVGGAPAQTPARLVDAGEAITVVRGDAEFVSRGGHKLAAALAQFSIDVVGLRCLDAGASSGGFTDCLLQRGAAQVVAVDVGHGQLAWSLRGDPRVIVRERTNVRTLTAAEIDGPVDLAVADLSFISLRAVAGALAAVVRPGGDLVLLVKPQFEAGRERVGKGGVIRDPATRLAVVSEVVAGLSERGLAVRDIMESPITGADGNVEYLARAVAGSGRLSDLEIERRLAAVDLGKTGE